MENVQGQHQNAGPPQKRRRRHRQNTLLPQRPKKPATGYTMFLRNYFSTHPTQEGVSARELLGQAGAEWRALTDQQKQQYQELCRADIDRYRHDMELWNRQKEVIKRPCSAYALFVKDYYVRAKAANEKPVGHVTEVGKKIKEQWDALAVDVKNEYKLRYQQSLIQFRERMTGIEQGTISIENLVNGVQPAGELGAGDQQNRDSGLSDDEVAGDQNGNEQWDDEEED